MAAVKTDGCDDEAVGRLAQLTISGRYAELLAAATRAAAAKPRNADGRTALWLSADVSGATLSGRWQYAKCIELLLHLGADPMLPDSAGDMAAHAAARQDNARFLALLPLEAKFVANRDTGRTPLMEAAAAGAWGAVKHLAHLFRQKRFYDRKRQLLQARDAEGRTAIDIASDGGYEELTELLETELALEINQVGETLTTFTISGLTSEQQRVRKRIVEQAKSGDARGLRRLATRANCDLPDEAGFTALAWAAKLRPDICPEEQEMADVILLSLGADPTAANVTGFTCLHGAATKGSRLILPTAIRCLVDAGASVNCADWWGRTALMQAAWNNSANAAAELLALGADWSRVDQRGDLALAFASKSGQTDAAAVLRRYDEKSFFDEPIDPPSLGAAVATDHVESEDEPDPSDGNKMDPAKTRKTGLTFGTSPGPGYYPVTSPRGVCLIVNIDRYDPGSGFSSRDGSLKDAARVSELFAQRLDFRVELRSDLKGHEIARCLTKTAYKDHTQFGAFVCFLMAHGTKEAVYGRDGVPQHLKDLTTPFHPNSCPSLSGKPKIFFVQACRGSVAAVVSTDSASDPVPVTSRDLCPKNSDFLFCYASSEDAPAYRDPQAGSIFVQTLCDVIEAGHQREHLTDLMTEVNRRVRDNPVQAGKRLFLHVVTDTHSQLAYKVSLASIKG